MGLFSSKKRKAAKKIERAEKAEQLAQLASAQEDAQTAIRERQRNVEEIQASQKQEGAMATSGLIGRGLAGGPVAGRLRKALEEGQGREMASGQEGVAGAQRQSADITRQGQYVNTMYRLNKKLKKATAREGLVKSAVGLGANLLFPGAGAAMTVGTARKLKKAAGAGVMGGFGGGIGTMTSAGLSAGRMSRY